MRGADQRRRRATSAGAALIAALVCVEAQAVDRLELEVEPACAAKRAEVVLREELAVRLGDVSSQGWRLSWGQGDQGCALTLRDTEAVIAIPLSADADSETIRDAAVRIAWVVTMEQPRQPAPAASAESEERAAATEWTAGISDERRWWQRAGFREPYASADTQIVLSDTTSVLSVGSRLGIHLGERWSTGLRFMQTVEGFRSVEVEEEPDALTRLSMASLEVGYEVLEAPTWDLELYAAFGGGAGKSDNEKEGPPRPEESFEESRDSRILFSELGGFFHFDLASWMALETGIAYRRGVAPGENDALSRQISGPVFTLGMFFKWCEGSPQ